MRALALAARAVLLLIAAAMFVLASGVVGMAAQQCDSLDRVQRLLTDRYSERMIGHGAAGSEGAGLMVFVHPEGATWTVVVVLPDGTACLMASGTGWVDDTLAAGGEDI
jgi:hypothetical protein